MAKTPPVRDPSFATDGGALLVDPGTAKQATGWLVDEAPSAHNFNFLDRDRGFALAMLMQALGPEIAFSNIEFGSNAVQSGFTPDSQAFRYDVLSGRWYMSAWDIGSSVCSTYDIDPAVDKDTTAASAWNADSTSATYPANAGSRVPAPVSNGTEIATIADDRYFVSTDNTVANFGAATLADATWNLSKGLVWDDGNSLWLAAVNDSGGDGEVWSAASDFSGGWTLRSTPDTTYGMTAIANDGGASDRTIVTTDGPRCYTSTDGTTWTQRASNQITNGASAVWYDKNLALFLAIDESTRYLWFTTNGVSWTNVNTTMGLPAVRHVARNDDMTFFFCDSGAGTEGITVWALHSVAMVGGSILAPDLGTFKNLGVIHEDYMPKYGDILNGAFCDGGVDKRIMWEYTVSIFSGLAEMRYTGLDIGQ